MKLAFKSNDVTIFAELAILLSYIFLDFDIFRPLRLRLHEIGSVWNRYEIGNDKPCVYKGPGRSASDRFSYLVSTWFTFESDPVWNSTVPGWYRARVNQNTMDDTAEGGINFRNFLP